MKRDWDVIREVLLEIESLNSAKIERIEYEVANDDTSKSENAFLLWQAGFIQGVNCSTSDGNAVIAQDLTWKGHELLDTIRVKTVLERIKKAALEKGIPLTFDSILAIGKAMVIAAMT